MKKDRRSSLAEDFPKLVIDQSAETLSELMTQWPKGRKALETFAKNMVSNGYWEPVGKRIGSRIFPAYRRQRISETRRA